MPRIYLVFALLAGICLFMSFSANPPNGYTNAPGDSLCTDCHTNPGAQTGTITVTGMPAMIQPSTAYVLTITNTVTSGTAALAGFQMTILNDSDNQAGTMTMPSANSTLQSQSGRQYWEHNPAQAYIGNSYSWTVTWTSPAGPPNTTITAYAAGNVASGTNGNQNDKIVTSTVAGTLQASGPLLMVDIIASTDASCFDEADGSATASAAGGTAPYTYLWSNGASGAVANNLAAGTYTVTVTDNVGSTATNSVTITEPPAIDINGTVTNVSCFDGNDGAITASASGGTGALNFNWSNGASGATITGLVAGSYSVTVTDINGCTETDFFQVMEPSEIDINLVNLTHESCLGENDGSIQISVSGGSSPYFAEWSNGFIGNTITDLAPDTYAVTVTDGNDCTATSTFVIEAGGMVDVTVENITHVTCSGGNNGSITVEAFGGQAPYTYEWSNGTTGATNSNLSAGNYLLTATDDNGCDVVKVYVINQPAPIVITIEASGQNLCAGDSLVTLTALISGDNGPFSAQWSNGVAGLVNPDLPSGNYIITATDAAGCTASLEFIVPGPGVLTLDVTTTSETAAGANDGTATANVGGGTPDYTYLWSNDSTTQTITGLAPGTYGVTVTDANGCTLEGTGVVNAFGCTLDVFITGTLVVCEGDSSLLEAIPSGATGLVTYLWSDGTTGSSIVAGPGTHCVTITDAAFCSAEACLSIEQYPVPVLVCPVQDESAPGANDGAIMCLDSLPGIVSYMWSTGDTTGSITGLAPGEYCVTVVDVNGCASTHCFVVQPGNCNLSITSIFNGPVCSGDANGSISINVENATDPVTYAWSNGDSTATIQGLAAGIYQVTITDASGCGAIQSFELADPSPILIGIDSIGPVGATGDGYIFITATGGVPPYGFVWIAPDQTQLLTEDITGLNQSGYYTLFMIDANGCEVSLDSVFVDMDVAVDRGPAFTSLKVYPVPAQDLLLVDLSAEITEVLITGADGRLYKRIQHPRSNQLDVSDLESGWYILRITDGRQWYVARMVK